MKTAWLFLFTALLLPIRCRAEAPDIAKLMSQLPACGLQCIIKSIPVSTCASAFDTTCVCRDEALRDAVTTCVATACKPPEAKAAAKVQADACQFPVRDRKREILIIAVTTGSVAFICLLLRLYSRWITLRKFAIDDYIIIFCLPVFVAFQVVGQYTADLAFGVDIWEVPDESITLAFKLFYAAQLFYVTLLASTKIALLIFYNRIFPQQTFRNVSLVIGAWVLMSFAVIFFIQIFQCRPISFVWEGWTGADVGPHTCVNTNALTFAAAGMNVAQEIAILILPMPLVWKLQVSARVKAGIFFMFGLGVFVVITSCVRLSYLAVFARSLNPTWDYVEVLIWTGLEVSITLIIASLPAIKALLSHHFPGIFSTMGASTPGPGKSGPSSRAKSAHLWSSTAGNTTLTTNTMMSSEQIFGLESALRAKVSSRFHRIADDGAARPFPQDRVFAALGGRRTPDSGESQLELGDLRYREGRTDSCAGTVGSDTGVDVEVPKRRPSNLSTSRTRRISQAETFYHTDSSAS